MHKYLKGITLKDLLIFENDHYLVINKPPYISTLDDRNDPVDILKLAKEHHADAQVCHRLDKETSGALVIAFCHHAGKASGKESLSRCGRRHS